MQMDPAPLPVVAKRVNITLSFQWLTHQLRAGLQGFITNICFFLYITKCQLR